MRYFSLVAFAFALVISGCATAQTQSTSDQETLIWQMEQRIYEERAKGSMAYYLSIASKDYLGWPFGLPTPATKTQLQEGLERRPMQAGEILEAVSNGIAISGETAISYFTTHRTALPGGKAVDQRYENIHVFKRENGQWRLLASQSRLLD